MIMVTQLKTARAFPHMGVHVLVVQTDAASSRDNHLDDSLIWVELHKQAAGSQSVTESSLLPCLWKAPHVW